MTLDEIRTKIKNNGGREVRTSGNPNISDIDRELANAGKKMTVEDIPKQDVKDRRGNVKLGNVSSAYQSSTVETNKSYRIGEAVRPPINHDTGFSKFPKRSPEISDYMELFKWTAMMEAAGTLRGDLIDGVAAYNHFLNGKGKPRTFSYDRYVNNDISGRLTLRNAILDAQNAAINLWESNGKPNKFNFTGPAIPCGGSDAKTTYVNHAFPYPATENWQKTIGAHVIWLSGAVTVKVSPSSGTDPEFKMSFKLHAEDQYNFNPGAKDIVSGIPDDDNGKFVVVGFAHGYRNSSVLSRNFSWKGSDLGVASMGLHIQLRQQKPNARG
jgi:hypothetical protein